MTQTEQIQFAMRRDKATLAFEIIKALGVETNVKPGVSELQSECIAILRQYLKKDE